MYDEASEILDFLPIDRADLSEYIDHLWGSFTTLIESDEPVRPFALFPFHLLSMLSIQYRVFRISAHSPDRYLKSLVGCNIRNPNDLQLLKNNIPIIDPTTQKFNYNASVRNLSLIYEKHLFNFLKIVDVDDQTIIDGQQMVDLRSSYAHANGNIEKNIEEKIDMYLELHRHIQDKMLPLNDAVATKWLKEMESGLNGEEFINTHLAEEYLCPRDMQEGRLTTLEKRLNSEI